MGRTGRTLLVVALIAVVAALAPRPEDAQAAKWIFFEGDFRCEINVEPSRENPVLGKGVCRHRANFGNYFLMYFDFDTSVNTVFVDTVIRTGSSPPFVFRQEQYSFAEFRRRYGN